MRQRALIFYSCGLVDSSWKETLSPWFITSQTSDLRVLRSHVKENPAEALFLVSSEGCNWQALELLSELRRTAVQNPVVLVSAELTPDWLVGALRCGANDVLAFECSTAEVAASIERIRGPVPTGALPARTSCLLIGNNRQIREVVEYAALVARTEINILITGETGTGKEVTAEWIHARSRRAAGPLVAVNCAALPDTLLESELFGHCKGAFTGADRQRPGAFAAAAGGTLFLDEIGEMNAAAQAKLLRVLENRTVRPLGSDNEIPIDVRFLAATNQDPERLVREKNFREDLFFRLNVARIHLPPLRARREDIPLLIEHLMPQCAQRQKVPMTRLDARILERATQYDWPGNVRELRNFIEVVLAGRRGPDTHLDDLPPQWRDRLRMVTNRGDNERSRVIEALTCANGNKSEAARMLSCSRMTLYRKMVQHGIAKSGAA